MDEKYQEKRLEERRTARGGLKLTLADDPSSPIEGALVDISRHGFRAAHNHTGLVTGQEVVFEHPATRGRARVMWTRIQGSSVESGFLILNKAEPGE